MYFFLSCPTIPITAFSVCSLHCVQTPTQLWADFLGQQCGGLEHIKHIDDECWQGRLCFGSVLSSFNGCFDPPPSPPSPKRCRCWCKPQQPRDPCRVRAKSVSKQHFSAAFQTYTRRVFGIQNVFRAGPL